MSNTIKEQRWRYQKADGTPVWLALEIGRPCFFCETPIDGLSMGGPAVCGACDCGNNYDGTKWTFNQLNAFSKHFKKTLEGLPVDPAWDVYEKAHLASPSLPTPMGDR